MEQHRANTSGKMARESKLMIMGSSFSRQCLVCAARMVQWFGRSFNIFKD